MQKVASIDAAREEGDKERLHGRHMAAVVTRGACVADVLAESGNSGAGQDGARSGQAH
jgi:hypothetical protein